MPDEAVARLASRQYGLFARAQAIELGVTARVLHRRLVARRWLPVSPGVYSVPGWPGSWRRSLMLACLDAGPGTAVSHEAAAALHRLATFAPGPIVITVLHGDHKRRGQPEVHQSTDLRPRDRVTVDGLPVTTVARTLFDLAATTHRWRYELALDDAHVRGSCRIDEVRALYDELRGPGKRGMKMLGQVLAERGAGYVPPASMLERRLLGVLARGGLPPPRRQYPLPWRAEAEGRVDFAFPAARVLIEADGRRWHTRMKDFEVDRARDNEALNNDWRPYRFTWSQITKRPSDVCETVRRALSRPS